MQHQHEFADSFLPYRKIWWIGYHYFNFMGSWLVEYGFFYRMNASTKQNIYDATNTKWIMEASILLSNMEDK